MKKYGWLLSVILFLMILPMIGKYGNIYHTPYIDYPPSEKEDAVGETDVRPSLYTEDTPYSVNHGDDIIPSTESSVPTISSIQDIIRDIPKWDGKTPYAYISSDGLMTEDDYTNTSSYEYYSELDDLGRCGECRAVIGKDIMPTEERGEIGNVRPSGWDFQGRSNNNKYPGLVDGNYIYNRCHLIGYQLAGENDNVRNLITGTRFLNIDGMLWLENEVADYVRTTGNHVFYKVIPVFEGDDLVCSGLIIRAYSVEDKGEAIDIAVYAYNEQPGIYIDHENGMNRLLEE